MKNAFSLSPCQYRKTQKFISTILFGSVLVACGGSGSLPSNVPPVVLPPIGTLPPITPPPDTSAGLITNATIQNLAGAQSNTPISFGQVFAKGDVLPNESVSAKLSDGTVLPLQLDIKATHDDGSIRHAIISAILPQLAANKTETISLLKNSAANPIPIADTPAKLLAAGFTAGVSITLNGQIYTASADNLLKAGTYTTWLTGQIANEWLVSAPLKTAQGAEHPHLTARFAIRSYAGQSRARVDVTLENNWTYEPNPQKFTYDTQIQVGGQNIYTKTALTHFHHARWRKVFWWGGEPQIHIQHNTAYLIASKAIPNCDQSVVITSTGINAINNKWNNAVTEPMGQGMLLPAMPSAGGRPDIGPLPQWVSTYILSMDATTKKITLGTGDLAGSWPIHYRDKNTNLPVSIVTYPYGSAFRLASHSTDSSGKDWSFSRCAVASDCETAPYNYNPDTAHQPSLAYVPYLVTGDYFYLEELQFWANYNLLQTSPYYREFAKGLVKEHQVRGQAWSLRTLGQVASITPDAHPLKEYFNGLVNSNLDFYNTIYSIGNPNQLGVIDGSGKDAFMGIAYTTASGPQTGISPWMDDFFTWSTGYLTELGFTKAKPLLDWKAKFAVGRMTDPGFCWVDGATYFITVRPSASAPLFTTFSQAYLATMRSGEGSVTKPSGPMLNSTGQDYLSLACGSQAQADWRTQKDKDDGVVRIPWVMGEMPLYSYSVEGFPSNMQPALAVAADSGIPNAKKAWDIFIKRPIKPDYSLGPQFAIIPR